MGMFMVALSALAVRPPALAASTTVFLNSAMALALSGANASRLSLSTPVSDGITRVPIVTVAGVPAGTATLVYGTAFSVRVRLAISQELVKLIGRAIGLPWKEHWAGSAITTTGSAFCAATKLGLA